MFGVDSREKSSDKEERPKKRESLFRGSKGPHSGIVLLGAPILYGGGALLHSEMGEGLLKIKEAFTSRFLWIRQLPYALQ